MRDGAARAWRVCGFTMVVLTALVVAPATAMAHPSDFQTLTLDLIFGAEGLEVIDAALVESSGPGYKPFPGVDLRQQVARDVLTALGIAGTSPSINAETSERYHQVGFTIEFDASLTGDEESGFLVQTAELLSIVDELNLEKLKLSVCTERAQAFDSLRIDPSYEGRAPIDARGERRWCQVWELAPDDQPVTVGVDGPVLPMTGVPALGAVTFAMGLLATGFLLTRVGRDRSPKTGPDQNA